MKTKSDKRKITVQLWKPLLDKLNKHAAEACLNRDAYLDKVFAHEAKMLRIELRGKKNSDRAKSHIKECFARLKELHPVSLTLSAETADALTTACEEVNVWRDAFVNRVIYFLVAKYSVIEDAFDFKFQDHTEAIFDDGWEIKSLLLEPPLVAIGHFICEDPFLAIRECLRQESADGIGSLHDMPIGNPAAENNDQLGLAGFNVYLDDFLIPGTEDNKQWSYDILAELGL